MYNAGLDVFLSIFKTELCFFRARGIILLGIRLYNISIIKYIL